ncbi:hypothetical protein BS50DRAFT_348795 [Corynespora cassiicola Philippines]|uniref:Rhodopsin domain-containing protein n=1 Tax=Corynespora cassiicola Philippines TaxID=1448308 RepID=A0A2T2NQY7_CORCC|nr:hypothetical protein BS50DRAFT_348795 [Corynespora cassiicola Philippines]
MSAFTPEKLAYMEANRDASRLDEVYWIYSVPLVASTISTALRLWAKRAGRNGITLDDYLIVIATACLIGQCSTSLIIGPPNGIGRHVIVVSEESQRKIRQGDYIFSHFYDFALVFVKLGILAFYHRIFAIPLFRKIVWATAAFIIAWGIGITVTLALACRPIQAFWDARVQGECLHLVTFTYFTNISNLITDIWIFLMPIPVIWHLQLQTKRKLMLSLIFCIGLATCVVSSMRLTVVFGHGDPDFTWYYVPLGAYSAFEPLGGILCTNLPIIWHMVRRRKPLLPGSSAFKSHPSSTATPGSGSSRRSRFARSIGLSHLDNTVTDSRGRTVTGPEEENHAWMRIPTSTTSDTELQKTSEDSLNPGRAQFYNKVERVHTEAHEMQDTDHSEAATSPPKRQSFGPAPPTPQGLKKNVWEVRKK